MRIRLLKATKVPSELPPGTVVEVDDFLGHKLCSVGDAMQDKSLDGAKENKSRRKKAK